MLADRVFVLAALVSLSLVGVTACSGSSGSSEASSSARAVHQGGTLTVAVDADPPCLDPHVSPAELTGYVQRNVVDSLVARTADGRMVPWLATSWTVSPDSRTFEFQLRPGVTFHDGTAFDADAVKANFDHIAAPGTKSQYAAVLLGPYAGTQVVGPRTVRVTFSRPNVPFLDAASTTYLGMQSPRALHDHPDQLCAGGPATVGSGPFRFVSRVPGQSAELARYDAYNWAPATARHQGAAYLSGIKFLFTPEASVRAQALRSNGADVVDDLLGAEAKALRGDQRFAVSRRDMAGANYALHLNVTRPPFDQQPARLAVREAVDLDRIVAAVYAGQRPRAWSPLSPTTPGYDATLEHSWTYDPAEAGKLLDGLGYTGRDAEGYRTKDGKRLTVVWPYVEALQRDQRDVLDGAVQQDLRKVGIEVQRQPLSSGAYLARRTGGDYDVLAFSWQRSDPAVLAQLFGSRSAFTAGGANASRLADPAVDSELETGAATANGPARWSAYAAVQHRVMEDAAVLPTVVLGSLVGTATRVHDLAMDADAWPMLHDCWVEAAG